MRPDVPRSNIPGLVTQSGLAPPKLRASSKLSLFALLSSFLHHRQQTKHYLTAASIFNDEPVFALRVEETRPMAGRPIWKTHSEYPDRLGISRGHIHTQISTLLYSSLRHTAAWFWVALSPDCTSSHATSARSVPVEGDSISQYFMSFDPSHLQDAMDCMSGGFMLRGIVM
jgi:hypothetical protein